MLVEGGGDQFAGVDLADLDLLSGDLDASVDGHDPLDGGRGLVHDVPGGRELLTFLPQHHPRSGLYSA
ncbi:hypothetical protein, partial [Micromonospora craterilacus]|uniref:hypothetical protein n=1 Tax=Micromonospora craterilacus TaxID=1655439 RepID=UPI001F2EE6B0